MTQGRRPTLTPIFTINTMRQRYLIETIPRNGQQCLFSTQAWSVCIWDPNNTIIYIREVEPTIQWSISLKFPGLSYGMMRKSVMVRNSLTRHVTGSWTKLLEKGRRNSLKFREEWDLIWDRPYQSLNLRTFECAIITVLCIQDLDCLILRIRLSSFHT